MNKHKLAYVVGLALGDGNLSNPNGRAVRLRITCCNDYPELTERIQRSVQEVMPSNRVSTHPHKGNCVNVSCYSNQWESLLGWKWDKGSKCNQNVGVPSWIKESREYSIECIRGLIETDGSIYYDRGYMMVNIVTSIPRLAEDIIGIITSLGYSVRCYKLKTTHRIRYNIRLSKNVEGFLSLTGATKT